MTHLALCPLKYHSNELQATREGLKCVSGNRGPENVPSCKNVGTHTRSQATDREAVLSAFLVNIFLLILALLPPMQGLKRA